LEDRTPRGNEEEVFTLMRCLINVEDEISADVLDQICSDIAVLQACPSECNMQVNDVETREHVFIQTYRHAFDIWENSWYWACGIVTVAIGYEST
jgi:hypothetical protein